MIFNNRVFRRIYSQNKQRFQPIKTRASDAYLPGAVSLQTRREVEKTES